MQFLSHPCGFRRPGRRRGAAVVEFAVVAPLMILFTLGLVEFGRMMMVQHAATQTSREGARLASLPDAESNEVIASVKEEMASLGIPQTEVTVEPANLASAGAGTPVTVAVSVDAASASWLPRLRFLNEVQIRASTTMRRESVE